MTHCIGGIAVLQQRIRELTEENERLRERAKTLEGHLRTLSSTQWSGRFCEKCEMPTTENESILNFGICERCFANMLYRDDIKNTIKKVQEYGWEDGYVGMPVIKVRKVVELLKGMMEKIPE